MQEEIRLAARRREAYAYFLELRSVGVYPPTKRWRDPPSEAELRRSEDEERRRERDEDR